MVPCAGHGLWLTIRMKKYAVKKAPKIITSDMMKSSIPSVGACTREDWWASRRPVVLGVAVPDCRGFHQATAESTSVWTTCSTGLPEVRRTRSIRSDRSQPDLVSGKVEITMSSTRKDWSAFVIAV